MAEELNTNEPAGLIRKVEREGLITCAEAARRIGIAGQGIKHPDRSVKRLWTLGKLRGRRVGRRVMIDPRSVVEFVEFG